MRDELPQTNTVHARREPSETGQALQHNANLAAEFFFPQLGRAFDRHRARLVDGAVALVRHVERRLQIIGEVGKTIAEQRTTDRKDGAVGHQDAPQLALPELDARLVAPVEILAFAHRRGCLLYTSPS